MRNEETDTSRSTLKVVQDNTLNACVDGEQVVQWWEARRGVNVWRRDRRILVQLVDRALATNSNASSAVLVDDEEPLEYSTASPESTKVLMDILTTPIPKENILRADDDASPESSASLDQLARIGSRENCNQRWQGNNCLTVTNYP